MNNILILSAPQFEKIWGSNYFKDILKVSTNDMIGEIWTVSGFSNSSSIILNGEFKGKTLAEIYKTHKELFNNEKKNEFPILVKVIATSSDLSVQVHPDDEYAKKYENASGKTEGWLILDTKEDSKIVVGHNAKNKEELIKYIENDDYSHLLNEIKVKKGEFYPINSGTIHAIGKNIVLLEVQQSSDLTYRFYDYHRLDKNGKERELHVKKAIDVTKYAPYLEDIHNCFKENLKTIWDNKYFKVELVNITNELILKEVNNYQIFSVIEGEIEVEHTKLKLGNSFIVCSGSKNVEIKGNGKVVVTTSK